MLKKSLALITIAITFSLAITPAWSDELPATVSQSIENTADILAGPEAAIDQNSWSLVQNALGWLGAPYRRGGKSAEQGFDCSGFVGAVYAKTFGLVLPPSALSISKVGEPVSFAELKIGDLLFFNTLRRPFSHVGIYLGEGRFIHACSTGKQIKVDTLDQYYTKRLNGFRRINLG